MLKFFSFTEKAEKILMCLNEAFGTVAFSLYKSRIGATTYNDLNSNGTIITRSGVLNPFCSLTLFQNFDPVFLLQCYISQWQGCLALEQMF